MRATIKMIAERAGVSIGTVDRVLHDRPYVKEEVRRRVLEVMEELDYQPNRVASALATSGMARHFAIIQPTWESYVGEAMAGSCWCTPTTATPDTRAGQTAFWSGLRSGGSGRRTAGWQRPTTTMMRH